MREPVGVRGGEEIEHGGPARPGGLPVASRRRHVLPQGAAPGAYLVGGHEGTQVDTTV